MHSLAQLSICLDVPQVEAGALSAEWGWRQCLNLWFHQAKHVGKDNFCSLLSTAQTNSVCLAGLEAVCFLVSGCCLRSVTPVRETAEFTTGVNDAVCKINFLLQFPADLPHHFWVETCFMCLLSVSFLCTSQLLAIWIVYETEQSAVAVEISAICSALFPFIYGSMNINTTYSK